MWCCLQFFELYVLVTFISLPFFFLLFEDVASPIKDSFPTFFRCLMLWLITTCQLECGISFNRKICFMKEHEFCMEQPLLLVALQMLQFPKDLDPQMKSISKMISSGMTFLSSMLVKTMMSLLMMEFWFLWPLYTHAKTRKRITVLEYFMAMELMVSYLTKGGVVNWKAFLIVVGLLLMLMSGMFLSKC